MTRSGIQRRVETKRLFRAYGAFALSPDITPDGWMMAATLSLPWQTLLTAWSTMELYAVCPRPVAFHEVVTTSRHGSRDGLIVRRARRELPFRRMRGIPTVEPVRALLDIAVGLNGRPLERLVGDAIHALAVREREFTDLPRRHHGHQGLGNLLAVSVEDAKRRRTVLPLAEEMLLLLDTLPIPQPV